MFLEINHHHYCSSMSGKQLFLVKEEEKEIKLENSSKPQLENQDSHQEFQEKKQEQDTDELLFEPSISSSGEESEINPRQLEQSQVAESDDGFKTPTSLDDKIPVIKECPPPPKKPRPKPSTSTKRKFELSKRVESLFLEIFQEDGDDDVDQKLKKARPEDEE